MLDRRGGRRIRVYQELRHQRHGSGGEAALADAGISPSEVDGVVRNDMDLVSGAALADAIGARNLTYYGAAVAYVAERVQFGRKIVSFPAIKHRCADMAIAADDARSAAIHAVSAVQEGGDALRPAAAVVSGRAFLEGARENVHLHGGIGFTWEHSAHLYFSACDQ